MGLYNCNRLWYGVSSAVAIWQRNMESIIAGIEGVKVFIDDICIGAKNKNELITRIEKVLEKLHKHNIKINTKNVNF